ncbi:molybdopterin-dependent oxidoreductase, partial [Methylobacterium sp. E-065]|nr:molybdopterin-dependent oxidoreductase [Methylobacterium sp. E-065]
LLAKATGRPVKVLWSREEEFARDAVRPLSFSRFRAALDRAGQPTALGNWLGDRIFASYDDIVDRCCDAWNRLIDQPWKIMSLGLRPWAYRL